MSSALDAARKDIRKEGVVVLTKEQRDRILALQEKSPEPNEALIKLLTKDE